MSPYISNEDVTTLEPDHDFIVNMIEIDQYEDITNINSILSDKENYPLSGCGTQTSADVDDNVKQEARKSQEQIQEQNLNESRRLISYKNNAREEMGANMKYEKDIKLLNSSKIFFGRLLLLSVLILGISYIIIEIPSNVCAAFSLFSLGGYSISKSFLLDLNKG